MKMRTSSWPQRERWVISARRRPCFRSRRRAPDATSRSPMRRARRSPRSKPGPRVPRPANCHWQEPNRVSCRWHRARQANCRSPKIRPGSSRSATRHRHPGMWDFAFHGLALGAISLIAYVLRRQSLVEWKAAAELCGLESVEVNTWTLRVKARAGPVAVRIEPSSGKKQSVRIVVAAPGPPGFQKMTIQGTPLFTEPVQIGDPSFEGRFIVEGPVPLLAALLDEETRRLLSRLSFASPRLSAGELRAQVADEEISDVLPGLVEIGRRFAQPLDIPRRLAENASQD